METVRNNVTELSRFSRERRKDGGLARTALDDCRETAVLGVKSVLGEGLEQVRPRLIELANKAVGQDLYSLYMGSLELASDHRASIEGAFRKHFLQRFNEAARRDVARTVKGGNAPELSLLEPDDLELSLASDTLANAILNACVEELFGLDKRIGMLINDPDLTQGDNPLGPEVIAESLMAALDEQDCSMKARLLLVSHLSKLLPERIRDIYREINQQLVKKNVLPTIRVGLRRNAAAPVLPESQAPGLTGLEARGDVFSMLRQLLGGGGTGSVAGGLPIDGPALPGDAVANPLAAGFIQALGPLQRGQLDAVVRAGLDIASLNSGRVNILYGLRKGEIAGAMSSLDAMTLDIVAMVFDYILDDDRIPDAMKALIGRLQIPVLKVAMLDKAFFSQKSQPARRLLDTLAEAAIGWDAEEGHEGGLYRKVEELVGRILASFDDRIEVFGEVQGELEDFLARERHEAAVAAAPSVQAIRQREVAEASLRAAHDEVHSCLLGQPVPGAITVFLASHWQRMLADVCQKVGQESETWQGAVATMNDLVWTVLPKAGPDERRKLVDMLPGLLRRLDEGIHYLGLTQAERDRFFAELVKCHAEAVRSGLAKDGQGSVGSLDVLGMETDIPMLSDSLDFEPVEPVEAVEVAEVIEELEAAPELEMGVRASAIDTDLGSLARGSWIEYRQDDGSEIRVKLSWVSPMKGVYLFTNRQGQRAISINAEGLREKLEVGSVRILNDVPLMDRAVDSLMERLQRKSA